MVKRFLKEFLLAGLISLVPTLLIWLPFYLRLPEFWKIPLKTDGIFAIVSNYDGPLYLVIAKSLYNINTIKGFEFSLPVEYYAAHFPLYPLLIRLVGFLTNNYLYALLVITPLTSIFAVYFFFKLISNYTKKNDAIFLTLLFSFLPARWLIVRSIGSPEPLFIAGIIASVYFFQKGKYWLSAVFGAVSVLTKSPGILLFIAYALSIFIPKLKELPNTNFVKWIKSLNWKAYPIILMPISLLAVFSLYKYTFNDFFAYFHSGNNIHLFFPPFQIFNYSSPWVGTFWLEEIIFVYMIGALGVINLAKSGEKVLAWFTGIFFLSILFVSHRDVVRYALPIVPFLFVAFKDTLTKREFKYVAVLLIIPVYLFTLAFISQNIMPISNWGPFL